MSLALIRGPDYAERFITAVPGDPNGLRQLNYRGQVRYLLPNRFTDCITTADVARVLAEVQAVIPLGGIGNQEILIVPYQMVPPDHPELLLQGERFDGWMALSCPPAEMPGVLKHELTHALQEKYINPYEYQGFWRLIGQEPGEPDDPAWPKRPQEKFVCYVAKVKLDVPLPDGIPPLTDSQWDLVRMFAQAQFTDPARADVVICEDDRMELAMQIDNPTALLNGTPLKMDSPPVIKDSRTMLPFRFVAETLGVLVPEYVLRVDWFPATRTAQLVVMRK